MQLTVSITLSEQDAHNTANSFECIVTNAQNNKSCGGFVWRGSIESPTTIVFTVSGNFVRELFDIDIEILSGVPFMYTLDVGVD